MATDSNGKVLFTAGADSTIKSWNIQSAQLLKVSIYLRPSGGQQPAEVI